METCSFCTVRPATFTLYKVVLKTDKNTYQMGLVGLLEKIENWIFNQMYHLSASQILLMRPDLIFKFFQDDKPNEKIVNWHFEEFFICKECYQDYQTYIPTK